MDHKILFMTMILALCAAFGAPVFAAEKLKFDNDIPRSSYERIKSYYLNTLKDSLENTSIAKMDLNTDGLYEFIIKNTACSDDGLCRYRVLAENDADIYQLGEFEAVNVLLGTDTRHGVRNLLVYKSQTNDFDYDVYTWHPESSRYRKSGS